MGKVWDIKRPAKKQQVDYSAVEDRLIVALWRHGVTIERIFGTFYALEAMADARSDEIFGNDEEGQHGRPRLTVGDALLVTPEPAPKVPLGEVPF